jgi:hypothetical protein
MAETSLSRLNLAARCLAAIAVTGVVSPLVFAGVFTLVLLASSGGDPLGSFQVVVGIVSLFGPIFSIPASLVIGVVFELPKLLLVAHVARFPSCAVFALHMFSSIAAANVILFVWLSFSSADWGLFYPRTSDFSFWLLAFLMGGTTSAATWWLVVLKPLRRRGFASN